MSASAASEKPSSPDQSTTVRVLIVEDNLMNRRLAGFMVKNKGLAFDASSSGAEALLQLRAKKYDLVLMDIEMPGMNGYECTRKIRNELKLTLPIVAMTAHDSEEEKQKCTDSGMNGYLAKPIDEKEFEDVMRRFLSAGGR